MFNIVDKYKDMCIAFGGHKNAVGLSVSKENIAKLKEMIESEVLEEAQEIVEYDMLLSFKQLKIEMIEILLKLEPFGEKNPYPSFMFKNVRVSDKKEYDKVDIYMLSQEVEKDSVRKEISLVGICFDKEKGKNINIGDNIYIVARPKINEFNRKKKYKS